MKTKNIAIVGSGLVGSLLAIYLRRRKYQVTVFDRRPDIRTIKFSGRSINLALSTRGLRALEKIGIANQILELGIPLYKRTIHIVGNPTYDQYYGKNMQAIYSIPRGVLNKKMISLAEAEGTQFRFNEKVWNIDLPEAKIFAGDAEKNKLKSYVFDLIFGCDGAFSRVRHKMQRRSRFDYSQHFLDTGYKELSIPAMQNGKHQLDKNALHIWPRGKFMLIALPNLDGSFTCTLFMPHEGKISFEKIQSNKDLQSFWRSYFPDTLQIMPNLLQEYNNNPTSTLVTIRCYPWTYWNKVALVGDAAHAIVPFYGQGMNVGFEDVRVLDTLVQSFGDDNWDSIFDSYQKLRKPNGDAIADLSYRNFKEMSEKTADPKFILQKKIEKKFAEKYPDLWLPLYNRVTFSNQPYAEALKVGDQQEAIMHQIMATPDIESNWNSDAVMKQLLQKVKEEKL